MGFVLFCSIFVVTVIKVYLLFVCVYVECTCAVVHMWRPEDDFWEVFLFFHPVGLHGWKSRHNKGLLQASLGYDWAIVLALGHPVFLNILP